MRRSELAKRGWILFFFAIAIFYLYGLGAIPLVGPDEPRYAEVAREMLSRRDWITPTLGGLPWFEKPALLYWITIVSYRVLGVSEYSARLGPAICGLLSAVFVYWIASGIEDAAEFGDSDEKQKAREGLARYGALAFLSSAGVAAFSRAANFDIVLTMTLTAALACFFIWHDRYGTARGSERVVAGSDAGAPKAKIRALLFGFYFFVGLSLLAKGLVGVVIPFGIVLVYFVLRREWPCRSLLISLLWGIPTAVAVGAIWYGPTIARHGWIFVDQFIIQHHFARFVTNKYHHPQPFYYYLGVLPLLCLPWTIFLAAAFIAARRWDWRGETSLDRLRVFAIAWLAVPVVFFSFSESKLPGYILPVLPAAALLVSERLTFFMRSERGSGVLRLTGTFIILLALAGAWYGLRRTSIPHWSIIAAASTLLLAGAITLLHARMRTVLVIPIATFVVFMIAINCAAPIVAAPASVRDLLAVANARGFGMARVVQLHTIERTAEFYAAGRLDYDSDGQPTKLESALQVADAARRNGGVVLCFVPLEYEGQLTTYPKFQAEVVANNGQVSLVAVRVH